MSHSPFGFDWLLDWAERTPEATAVGSPAGWLTYRQLAERTAWLAAHLEERGVKPGDRVLVALANAPSSVVVSLAIQWLGACAVEVNREWGAVALAVIAAQIDARHAVIDARDALLWGSIAADAGLTDIWVVQVNRPSEGLWAALDGVAPTWLRPDGTLEGSGGKGAPPVRDAQAPALLLYTSGSTGVPRGVLQTHANIAANTRSICDYLELTAQDRAMAILPLCYCYGKSVLQTHLMVGGSVFFDHRFMYPRVVLEAISQERCTGFAAVPLTFELLERQVDPRTIAMPSLRYLTQAGGAMVLSTTRWVREAFAPARLFVMYGQTEATARLSYLPPDRGEDKAGSIGRAIPGVELAVVDPGGAAVPVNQEGHLVARGANVTRGYFRAPEETAEILRDGWLWTGDLARKDEDGFFFLTGRARDVLKIDGHRVSAAEMEQRLSAHPDVVEAAVVCEREPVRGEMAVAFVVRRAGATLSEADLRRYCRAHLPPYKVPGAVRFVEALPRTSVGKVAKGELLARLA
jgi:acyl-coenzyme A synthetase/AMP-(fatty) acid ligase